MWLESCVVVCFICRHLKLMYSKHVPQQVCWVFIHSKHSDLRCLFKHVSAPSEVWVTTVLQLILFSPPPRGTAEKHDTDQCCCPSHISSIKEGVKSSAQHCDSYLIICLCATCPPWSASLNPCSYTCLVRTSGWNLKQTKKNKQQHFPSHPKSLQSPWLL